MQFANSQVSRSTLSVTYASPLSLRVAGGKAAPVPLAPITPVNLDTLNPGQQVTITFDVTINAGFTGAQVCNQGNVTADGGINVLTDDPDSGTANDATCTAVTLPVAPPSIAKSFSPNPIAVGGVSTLTLTITNPNAGTALTGVAVTDSFPADLVVAAAANASTTGCGSPTYAPVGGNAALSLSGATIAAGGTCVVSVDVTAPTAGSKVNTTGIVSSANGGNGNTATSTLTVVAAPLIAKAFNPTVVVQGAPTTLTFTITNPAVNVVALTDVGFTDVLQGMVVANPSAASSDCAGGVISAVPLTTVIALAGATVPVGGSCTLSVNVTPTTFGDLTNTTGNVVSGNGGAGGTASARGTVIVPVIPTLSQWGLLALALLVLLVAVAALPSRRGRAG